MATVTRTPEARADLVEILLDLRGRNPLFADRFEADLEQKCELLAQFPLMGRSRDELAPSLRSILVKPYVVFYRPLPDDQGVVIIRVLHGHRDLPAFFNERR